MPGGPLSPALKDWAVDVKEFACYKPDPAKAQALLKEAGVATPVALTMIVLPRQDIKDIAQVVQQQLNKAGFKVELKSPELGQFIQDWRNSNFDLFASTNAGSPDPDDYFYRTFRTGGSTNVFKYSNAEVDALLDRGRAPSTRRRARPTTPRCRRSSPARARSPTSPMASSSPRCAAMSKASTSSPTARSALDAGDDISRQVSAAAAEHATGERGLRSPADPMIGRLVTTRLARSRDRAVQRVGHRLPA